MKKKFIIIAPHADDEIIGCFTLLRANMVDKIVFGTKEGAREFGEAIEKAGIRFEVNYEWIGNWEPSSVSTKTLLFPDPTYERHPEHRRIGMFGEELLRMGKDVIFYTTNMCAPYIFEVSEPQIKRECLNSMYPNKQSLWMYDHKYFLFEGFTKWLIGTKICQG